MKSLKSILLFGLVVVLIAACEPKAAATRVFNGDNPYAPQIGDGNLMADDITIDSSSVFSTKSLPPQILVKFAYFQPTPCYQLRVEISGPGSDNHINLKGYAVAEKDKACTLMALATPLQASLNLGSFPKGHYFVVLNGNQIGEFDS
jgi:hypothetical protein